MVLASVHSVRETHGPKTVTTERRASVKSVGKSREEKLYGTRDEYESEDARLFNYEQSPNGVSDFPARLASIFEMTGG